MNISLKSTIAAILLASAFGVSSQAQAAVLLDGFGDDHQVGTTVTDDTTIAGGTSNSPTQIFNTGLTDPMRTITAEAVAGGGGGTQVIISNGSGSEQLEINNSVNSNGIASFFYDFTANPEPFSSAGDAFAMDISSLSSSTIVEFLVNGALTSSKTITGTGTFYVLFSSFVGGITDVSSLSLTFKNSTDGWSLKGDELRIDAAPTQSSASTTPEPATLALMGLGLACFAAARKKKQA